MCTPGRCTQCKAVFTLDEGSGKVGAQQLCVHWEACRHLSQAGAAMQQQWGVAAAAAAAAAVPAAWRMLMSRTRCLQLRQSARTSAGAELHGTRAKQQREHLPNPSPSSFPAPPAVRGLLRTLGGWLPDLHPPPLRLVPLWPGLQRCCEAVRGLRRAARCGVPGLHGAEVHSVRGRGTVG